MLKTNKQLDDSFETLYIQLSEELSELAELTVHESFCKKNLLYRISRLLSLQFERGRVFERKDLQHVLKEHCNLDLKEIGVIKERF